MLESLKNFAKLMQQIYSTINETKAAFAEGTVRSIKIKIYRYLEELAYENIHNMSQFVAALNSTKNRSMDLIPKNIRNKDFLSILYSKPLREHTKPKFKIGDRVRNSK